MSDHECIDCIAELATYRPRKIVTTDGEPKRCASHQQLHVKQTRKRARARSIERTYGISAEDAHELFLLQLGRCWLCQKATGATKSLAVDHDHQTGEVRGRLCGPCNQFIGRLGDDPAAAQRLVRYLTGDTPYRRLKALQAFSSVYGEPVAIARVWMDERSQRLAAEWGRTEAGATRFELVPVFDGVTWSTAHVPTTYDEQGRATTAVVTMVGGGGSGGVADSEPRVETPGECGSCHALPDQPHTEYCELRRAIVDQANASGQVFPSPPTHIADHPVR